MKPNDTLENVFATLGAVLWSLQIAPQIWKSYREKSTHGLSLGLMATWSISNLPFGSYIVAQKLAIPLQVQPHAFGLLCLTSTSQVLYYGKGWSLRKTLLFYLTFVVVWAGFETGSIYALWAGLDHGTDVPMQLYGYLTAVLLAGALLPQYWEIYRLKEVLGISLLFMAVDILGGVFSLLSLTFRAKLDVAACVSYSLVIVLDGIVVILAFTLNPITRRRRRKAAERAAEEEMRVGSTHSSSRSVDRTATQSTMVGGQEELVDRETGEKIVRAVPMPDLRIQTELSNHDSPREEEEKLEKHEA